MSLNKNHKDMVKHYFYSEECGLLESLLDKLPQHCEGEVRLFSHMLSESVLSLEEEYFKSKGFELHCKLLKLNHEKMSRIIFYMLDIIKNDKEWVL